MIELKKLILYTLSAALFASLPMGCSLGPRVLRTDYLEYNKSVQMSAGREMLLNLVRLRYLETPLFLQIGAISSTHQYQATLGATATIPDTRLARLGIIPNYGLSLGNAVGETPTVTFTPLAGEQYVQRILSDITLADFCSLYDTGWDMVMKTFLAVLVEQIGELKYQLKTGDAEGRDLRRLKELYGLLDEIQMRGDLHMGVTEGEGLVLSDRVPEAEVNPASIIAADSAGYYYKATANGNYELRKRSGLRYVMMLRYRSVEEADKVESYLGIGLRGASQGKERLSRVYELRNKSSFGLDNKEQSDIPVISIGLRSFQQVLLDLSAGVDPAPQDLSRGGADRKRVDIVADAFREYMKPIIHVKSSSMRPSNDFVSVSYRGSWFYIDDKDVQSRVTFDLIQILFSLRAAEKQGAIPTLTIPVR